MTLSRWLRDYLYIPLGGNRKGRARTYANLMATMLLGGLWHGASWNFVAWGGLHGAYLAFERAALGRWRWWNATHPAAQLLRVLVTFHLTCLAWIFFRSHHFPHALAMLANLSHPSLASFDVVADRGPALLVGTLFLAQLLGARLHYKERIAASRGPLFAVAIAAAIAAMILFAPVASAPFIYFQF